MAGEIQAAHLSGKNVYALVRNAAGSVWNGSAFVTYATANLSSYAITLTEQGTASGYYAGTFPVVSAGVYAVVAYERAGGSPAEGDTLVASGNLEWDGSAVVPLSSRLAPTVAGRTLDVSAGGEAGLDWANVGSPSTTVSLSGTTVATVTTVNGLANNSVTAAAIATDAIDSDALATSAITEIQAGLSTLTAAQVNTEVVDVIRVDTLSELATVPSATPSLDRALMFLFMALRNQMTVTAADQKVRNDAGGVIATAALSDDGATFTRAKFT